VSPPTLLPGGGGDTNTFVPATFGRHKVNLLSSSSVISFFYHLKSMITNLRGMGKRKEGKTRPPTFSLGRRQCCPRNFCIIQRQSSIITLSSFIFFLPRLKSVITNLKWMRGINSQIIWLHFSNDLEILLVNAFVPLPPNFCMTQSQSSFIKFSFFSFLKVSDNKPRLDEGYKPPNNLVAFFQ